MTNVQIVMHESFGATRIDIFRKDNRELVTRSQVAEMLGVSSDAIRKIHDRNANRLNHFSVADKMSGTDGKYTRHTFTLSKVYSKLPAIVIHRKPMKS